MDEWMYVVLISRTRTEYIQTILELRHLRGGINDERKGETK